MVFFWLLELSWRSESKVLSKDLPDTKNGTNTHCAKLMPEVHVLVVHTTFVSVLLGSASGAIE